MARLGDRRAPAGRPRRRPTFWIRGASPPIVVPSEILWLHALYSPPRICPVSTPSDFHTGLRAAFCVRRHRSRSICRAFGLGVYRRMAMRTGLARVVTCCLLVMAGAASAGAQQFTGGVRGAVRDANGVIPGVAVTLTNEATNITRDTVTNEVGQYNFPAVTPGTYTLKTQLTGYKTHESKGLVVATQQFITLDVALEVGALEESITVTGQTPLIDTSTASTGGVLDREA